MVAIETKMCHALLDTDESENVHGYDVRNLSWPMFFAHLEEEEGTFDCKKKETILREIN